MIGVEFENMCSGVVSVEKKVPMLIPPTILVAHYQARFKLLDLLVVAAGIETRLKNSQVLCLGSSA